MEKFNSRSVLARMMAEEDIFVEHDPAATTASFLLKHRTLVLPVWKDVSDAVYIAFVGHEVGHALFTEAKDWDAALDDKFWEDIGIHQLYWKDTLNVVEDIRIERLIKNRFQGIRRFFSLSYRELMGRSFFGPKEQIPTYDFISRINVHYKLGDDSTMTFSEEERPFLKMLDSLTDFQSVVRASKELAKYTKYLADRRSTGEEFDREEADGENEGELTGSGLRRGGSGGVVTEYPKRVVSYAVETASRSDFIDPTAKKVTDVIIPRPDVNRCVTPWRKIYTGDNSIVKMHKDVQDTALKNIKNFRKRNHAYLSQLIREFHLHRSAKRFRKTTVSKTGKLDINKIAHYKTKNDLFLRNTIIPDDKNHGMVMMVDMSSSMYNSIKPTIQQTVLLAEFCRRVKIPFVVYTFTNSPREYGIYDSDRGCLIERKPRQLFSEDSLSMMEILSSEMNDLEYNLAAGHCLTQLRSFVPMSGTPLDQAMIYLTELAVQFNKKHKKEKLMTVVLTDGQGHMHTKYTDLEGKLKSPVNYINVRHPLSFETVETSAYRLGTAILEMYKHVTGSKLVSYYVTQEKNHYYECQSRLNAEGSQTENFEVEYHQQQNQKGYFRFSPNLGYDAVYVIPDKTMIMKSLDFDDDRTYTLEEIEDEFNSQLTTQVKTRVFVNEFITQIA